MSGADEARGAIHTALRDSYAPVWKAGADYAATVKTALAETDLVAAMGATLDVIRAAEHLHDVAENAAKTARSQLELQMADTGCFRLESATLSGHLARKPAFVDVSGTVPPEYMHTPEPTPDKRAIKRALEAGADIPNAALVRPNDYRLSIRIKQP